MERDVAKMRAAHKVLARFDFEPKRLKEGYADRWLRVDLGTNQIEVRPVTQEMKDLWVGGKGFDLWLTFQEVDGSTRWDSPNNPICFSSGPLGGTTSYPGSGKTLVTAISPMTDIMIDCNVGGYFGPYLKFAGFDALMVIGKAAQEVLLFIDATRGQVTIETAPEESVDSHVLAEELTEAFADDVADRRNIAVVAAGRGAQHTRMGVLNFSFYDWRRRVARLKQAGRGGVGTVFRDKRLKALVIKNRGITPAWRVSPSKAEGFGTGDCCPAERDSERAAVVTLIAPLLGRSAPVVDLLQAVQDSRGCVSRAALEEISRATATTVGALFEIVTFYRALSLECGATGLPRLREELAAVACRQLFAPGSVEPHAPELAKSFLAPGIYPLLASLLDGGEKLSPATVRAALGATGAPAAANPAPDTAMSLASAVRRTASDSCGKCTPCREGLAAADELLERVAAGDGTRADLQTAAELAELLGATSLCAFGMAAGELLSAGLDRCRDELGRLVAGREVK